MKRKMKSDVHYEEIWKIAENPKLGWGDKRKELEGCIRRLVREMKHKPMKTTERQRDYEYRLIEVSRALVSAKESALDKKLSYLGLKFYSQKRHV